jgi:hypothetical protein
VTAAFQKTTAFPFAGAGLLKQILRSAAREPGASGKAEF